MSEQLRPLEALAERRDELAEAARSDLDVGPQISEIHFEIDNELADHNHMAVVQHVEHAVSLLRTLEALDLQELARLEALVITGTETPPRPGRWDEPVPADPEPAGPTAFFHGDPDDLDSDDAVSDAYAEAADEASRAAVDDWAWHLRRLLRHAAELAGTIVGETEDRLPALIERRDESVAALERAVKSWEVALAADMEVNGPTWQIAAFESWLDSTR